MNNAYEANGVIDSVKDLQVISEKFSKRDLWLTIPGKYPQTVVFTFANEGMRTLDNYKAGDEVRVTFNLRGNVKGDRCWTTLSGWKVDMVSAGDGDRGATPMEEASDMGSVPF